MHCIIIFGNIQSYITCKKKTKLIDTCYISTYKKYKKKSDMKNKIDEKKAYDSN